MRDCCFALTLLLTLLLEPVFLAPQSTALSQGPGNISSAELHKFEELSRAAERARNENRDEQAIGFYQQALALRPTWPEGLWYLGTLLYENERYANARDILRHFLTLESASGPGWALLGMSEFQTREYARSLEHLERAMSLGLGDRKEMAQSVFYFVAVLRTRFELYSESISLLMAVVQSGQSSDALIEPLGLAALRLPFLPQEIPENRRELIRLAGRAALSVQGQHNDDAEKLFSEMVTNYPKEPGVHFLYGAYLMDQRPEDGIREMRRELEISPSSVPARLRLAEQYTKEQNAGEALRVAQEAVALEPKSGTARLVLGEALIAKGDSTAGILELEKARDQAPDRVRTHWDLFRAYSVVGRLQDANREKEEIEKLNAPASQQ
jgi:tetratricopeptide (TPR) repeat protein